MAKVISPFSKTLLAAALALGGGTALAAQGDWIVRAGWAYVDPDAESDNNILGIPGAEVDVDSASSLGITIGYMATDNIGVGLLGAWPFEHDIEGDGSISSLDDVAEIKHLPPTLTVQWHFLPEKKVRPFLGAGVNYTHFFDEDTKGALSGSDIDLDDSWGYAFEGGVDIDITDRVFIGAQIWYINIETEADVDGSEFDVDINPWVYMLSVGTRF